MRLRTKRLAFTLIELIVVIALLLVLATLALLITPRMAEDQRVARGADQVSGWLLVAKQRTFRDQVPRGVRLVQDPTNPAWVKELVYIERPEDLRGSFIVVPAIPAQQGTPVPQQVQNYATVFIPDAPGAPAPWYQADIVKPGDYLQMNSHETAPYNVHRIATVQQWSHPQFGPGTLLVLQAQDGTFSPINIFQNGRRPTIQVVPNLSANPPDQGSPGLYQIVRAPRPMAGESVLPLPRDIVIDLDPNTDGSSLIAPSSTTGQFDIMFNERGQVVGDAGQAGRIILRMRPSDRPYNQNLSITATNPQDLVYDAGEQLLITIVTRTGLIATHPVNPTLRPGANGQPGNRVLADPYSFTRDGLTSGM
ncbi:MAG: prepilin-type N-terminal cleavage/methylation domain-containing protein [Gemmataceae bacterium]